MIESGLVLMELFYKAKLVKTTRKWMSMQFKRSRLKIKINKEGLKKKSKKIMNFQHSLFTIDLMMEKEILLTICLTSIMKPQFKTNLGSCLTKTNLSN